eukprot:1158060-Pelagomonas_calceolata.AAC.11
MLVTPVSHLFPFFPQVSPHTDEYKSTPLSHVAEKTADFAITPSESVISYNTWPDGSKPKVQGIAACLQDSTSASELFVHHMRGALPTCRVVTLKDSGLDRPNKLDGKHKKGMRANINPGIDIRYASYGARYEGRIVQMFVERSRRHPDEIVQCVYGLNNRI